MGEIGSRFRMASNTTADVASVKGCFPVAIIVQHNTKLKTDPCGASQRFTARLLGRHIAPMVPIAAPGFVGSARKAVG